MENEITKTLTLNEFMHYFELELYCKNILKYRDMGKNFDFMVDAQIENIIELLKKQ